MTNGFRITLGLSNICLEKWVLHIRLDEVRQLGGRSLGVGPRGKVPCTAVATPVHQHPLGSCRANPEGHEPYNP